MSARPDPRLACGFCEGTGLWAALDGPPDPCPHCGGVGTAPGVTAGASPGDAPRDARSALAQARALVAELTPVERQQLYEELYARWDCRIYRP